MEKKEDYLCPNCVHASDEFCTIRVEITEAVSECEKFVKYMNTEDRQGKQFRSDDGLKGRLIKHAASLLTERLSDYPEDYHEGFSWIVLADIQNHNERLRKMAIDLRLIAEAL